MAKKKVEVPKEKRFHVVAVPYQRNFTKFAAAIEDQINGFLEQGCDVTSETHPQGVLILARRSQIAEESPMAVLRRMAQRGLLDSHTMSPGAGILLSQFLQQVDLGHPENFKGEVAKRSEELLKGHSSEALMRVRKEFEENLRTHSERCSDPDCNMPKLMTEVVESIKRHVQLHLQ